MIEHFLTDLFGEALTEQRRVGIFTLPGAQCRHFSSLTAAGLYAARQARTKDVYFQLGLAGRNFGHKNSSSDIVSIGSLWADIDILCQHHKETALPKSIDEAKLILAKMPVPASIIMDSGHGLHAYWLFKESWIFNSQEDWEEAFRMAKGWHQLACQIAESFGWKLQNLGELGRVLRLPGTFNRKDPDAVVEVKIIEDSPDRRYDPCELEQFIPELVDLPESTSCGKLFLGLDAEPPLEKFADLHANSSLFWQSWNRKREDLQDQSQSAYDQSLANIAALNNWSDQQIANLIIAARRKHGKKPEKALRVDYMTKTIGNATSTAQEQSVDGVDLSGILGSDSDPLGSKPKTLADVLDDPSLFSPKPRLPSTFPALDEALRGGFVKSGMYCLAGMTGRGKSTLSSNLVRRMAACGTKSLFITLEEDEVSMARKFVAQECRIPALTLEKLGGNLQNYPDEGPVILEAVKRLKELPILLEGETCELGIIEQLIHKIKDDGIEFVLIDQSSWIDIPNVENDFQLASQISRRIKCLAKRLGIVVVVLVQINRAGAWGNRNGQDLELYHIRDSGRWEQDSDGVLIIQTSDENSMRVDVKKHRHGPRDLAVHLGYEPTCSLVEDHPDLDEPVDLAKYHEEKEKEEQSDSWDIDRFVSEIVVHTPRSVARIIEMGQELGLSERRVQRLLTMAEEDSLIHPWKMEHGKGYATRRDHLNNDDVPHYNKRAAVETKIRECSNLSSHEIAETCGVTRQYVNRVKKELRND